MLLTRMRVDPNSRPTGQETKRSLLHFRISLNRTQAMLPYLRQRPTGARVTPVAVCLAGTQRRIIRIDLNFLMSQVMTHTILTPTQLPTLTLVTSLPHQGGIFPLSAHNALNTFTQRMTAYHRISFITNMFTTTVGLNKL